MSVTPHLGGYERPHLPQQEVVLDQEHSVKVYSVRRKRLVFTLSVTAFLLGTLLILFNSPVRNEFLAPGPLSDPHAQILKGADRCSACHDAGHQTLAGWVANLWSRPDTGQSENCMKCHENSIQPQLALTPHNQPAGVLKELTNRRQNSTFRLASFGSDPAHAQEVACRTCHQEHHGNEGLNVLTDRQCQTCHSENYHSFELDHPEFSGWPYSQPRRIEFDHISHSQKHFVEKGDTFSCNRCHQQDASGNVQLLTGYGQACASCHDEGIRVSGQRGIKLLQLPMLDVQAFRDLGLDIGSWPDQVAGSFEGEIPPLMQLLLAADEEVETSLIALGSDFDFVDMEPDDKDMMKHARVVVMGIKKLVRELADSGTAALRQRIEHVVEKPLNETEWVKLSSGLNQQIFFEMVSVWWPELEEEIALPPTERIPDKSARIQEVQEIFARYRQQAQEDENTLVENPLAKLLSKSTRTDIPRLGKSASGVPEAEPGNAIQGQSEQGTVQVDPANRLPRVRSLTPRRSGQVVRNSKDELVKNPLVDLLRKKEGVENAPVISSLPPEPPPNKVTKKEVVTTQPAPVARSPRPRPIPVGAMQGWFRDDTLFSIQYRPVGHGDPVLEGWLNAIGKRTAADTWVGTRPAFHSLISPTSPGECRRCHSLEAQSSGEFLLHWNSRQRDPFARGFTRFNHQPHMTLSELRDCKSCHRMDLSSSEVGFDFEPISKMDCATCHREGAAPNGCTTCHNYHVHSLPSGVAGAPVDVQNQDSIGSME